MFVKFDFYLKMMAYVYKTLHFYQTTGHHISRDGNVSLHILSVT